MSQDGKPLMGNKQLLSTPQLCIEVVQDYASEEISKVMDIKSIFAAFFKSVEDDHTPSNKIDSAIAPYVAILNQHDNTRVGVAICGKISGSIREREASEEDKCCQFSKRLHSTSPKPERSTKKCAPNGDDADAFSLSLTVKSLPRNWSRTTSLTSSPPTKYMVLSVKQVLEFSDSEWNNVLIVKAVRWSQATFRC